MAYFRKVYVMASYNQADIAFGNSLRRHREARGMSQAEFALRSGIDPTYYGRIERGEHSATVEKCQKMATALGLDLEGLFSDDANEGICTRADVDLGAILQRYREGRKMSVAEFASLLGMEQRRYRKYERGKRSLTVSECHKICEVLSVRMADLCKRSI